MSGALRLAAPGMPEDRLAYLVTAEWNGCISFWQQQIFKQAISTTEKTEDSPK